MVALHMPLCVADLRLPVSDTVWATDAIPTTGGSVEAAVPEKLARALFRCCEQHGCYTRLDRDGALQPEAHLLHPRSPDIDALATSLDWKVTSAYHFRSSSHVNLQELRAVAKCTRDAVEESASAGAATGSRQIVFCDSV